MNINENGNKTADIKADTPKLEVSIEYDGTDKGEWEFSSNEEVKEFDINNMNFGIIENPKISLGFDKTIKNVKVTNAQGNIIIDGNPGDKNLKLKYLSNLDNKEHLVIGSDYAKIEIKDEEIYGAKLEITYAITIINDSDVNYYEDKESDYYGYYYMFGDSSKSKEVNITIEEVYDYLDSKLALSGNSYYLEEGTEENVLIIKKDTEPDSEGKTEKSWKPIYSKKITRTDGKVTQDTAEIIATRTLSNTESDMDFTNKAEVVKIHVTDEPLLVENINAHLEEVNGVKYINYFNYVASSVHYENPSKTNSLTIVPPTGLDMLTPIIYIAVSIIAGIIITIGIIVIKKKVLDK